MSRRIVIVNQFERERSRVDLTTVGYLSSIVVFYLFNRLIV